MSTDWYQVQVLAVEPVECRLRLRIWVVYYDEHTRRPFPLPDDISFFLRVLWDNARDDGGALREALNADQVLDEDWVDANAWLFVERFQRLATRNHPMSDEDFDRGVVAGWNDDDSLVRADYDVWMTDPRWLPPGPQSRVWWTTSYDTVADRLRVADLAFVPDLRAPVAVRVPFPGLEVCPVTWLAFSDDSRYLAVAGTFLRAELAGYATGDWTESVRVRMGGGGDLLWSTGRNAITRGRPGDGQWAYDVDAGREVEVPPEAGWVRSLTGRYRAEYGVDEHDGSVVFVRADGAVVQRIHVAGAGSRTRPAARPSPLMRRACSSPSAGGSWYWSCRPAGSWTRSVPRRGRRSGPPCTRAGGIWPSAADGGTSG
jgi:hypothetical protein